MEESQGKPHRKIRTGSDTIGGSPNKPIAPDETTPVVHHHVIDRTRAPLPSHVDEIDIEATQVAPSAFNYKTNQSASRPGTARRQKKPARQSPAWSTAAGCLLRGAIVFMFALIALVLILAAAGIYQYYAIASDLPSVSDLQERASQFETTRILDRNGAQW